jgi:hypothetical protein
MGINEPVSTVIPFLICFRKVSVRFSTRTSNILTDIFVVLLSPSRQNARSRPRFNSRTFSSKSLPIHHSFYHSNIIYILTASYPYAQTPWLLVSKLTILTERPPLVGEVSANFFAEIVSRGQRNGLTAVNSVF